MPRVDKIAVLRANALGDLIFALQALHALRTAYRHAEIVLLGQAWHAELMSGRPSPIDRVIVLPPAPGVNGPLDMPDTAGTQAERERFFAAMQLERFDLAIQLHGGGGYSNPFIRRLGARVTAGLRAADAPPLDRWIPYVYYQHETLRLLEVVGLVGAQPPTTLEPQLAVTEADLAEAAAAVPG